MEGSLASPRGFDSAEADEVAREAARAEARRYRNSELGNAFPRREIPAGGCPAGRQWSSSTGTCLAGNGNGSSNTTTSDVPLPTLVTLLLATAIAGVIFVVLIWTLVNLVRAIARKLRSFANNAKDTPVYPAIDTLARIVEHAVAHMDTVVGKTTPQSGAGDRSSEAADDENDTPSGVRLGSAMGAVVFGLARSAPEKIGREEARLAAGEMASALTAYLEAGDAAADEFRTSFTVAAEKAFEEKRKSANVGSAANGTAAQSEPKKDSNTARSRKTTDSRSSWQEVTPVESPVEKSESSATSGNSETPSGGWFSGFAVDPIASFTETFAVGKITVTETETTSGRETETKTTAKSTSNWGLTMPEILQTPESKTNSIVLSPDPSQVLSASLAADDKQLKALDLAVRYREVLSKEKANDIAEKHLSLSHKALETQKLNLNVLSENNAIHNEANMLAAEKLEGDISDRKEALEAKKHTETLLFIADAFYAGLVVVFVATLAGGWRRAVAALSATVSVCPAPDGWFSGDDETTSIRRKPKSFSMSRTLWSYATGTGGPGPAEYIWCVSKSLISAMSGGVVFALVAWKLLQYNVVNKFQTAPATVLLLLLGVGCGHVGRSAVDALGGDGDVWLRLWRTYVLFVATCTWRANFLRRCLDACGPLGRFGFFGVVALVFPFTVGAAPFEDVFAKIWIDIGAGAETVKDRVVEAAEVIGFGFVF
mgnify:FL=1|tara:strand:+ start:129 stop:2270 length:2142 start_codon:yes stop_codon:yes gene_type:complete